MEVGGIYPSSAPVRIKQPPRGKILLGGCSYNIRIFTSRNIGVDGLLGIDKPTLDLLCIPGALTVRIYGQCISKFHHSIMAHNSLSPVIVTPK